MHSGWYCNRRLICTKVQSPTTLIVRVTGVSCFDFVETVSLLSESEDESELSLEDSAVCLAPSANEESFFSLSEERAEPVVFSSVALFYIRRVYTLCLSCTSPDDQEQYHQQQDTTCGHTDLPDFFLAPAVIFGFFV